MKPPHFASAEIVAASKIHYQYGDKSNLVHFVQAQCWVWWCKNAEAQVLPLNFRICLPRVPIPFYILYNGKNMELIKTLSYKKLKFYLQAARNMIAVVWMLFGSISCWFLML